MSGYPDKPLKELSDTELLDFLDIVSEEVKSRNSLKLESVGKSPGEAMKEVVDIILKNIDPHSK